jgi:hypothetical protein
MKCLSTLFAIICLPDARVYLSEDLRYCHYSNSTEISASALRG